MKILKALGVLLTALPAAALAQPYAGGPGGIVLVEGAAVYSKAQGGEVADRLRRGDAVLAATPVKPLDSALGPEITTLRLVVNYFHAGKASPLVGWMNPADISRFMPPAACSPIVPAPGGGLKWSTCFEQARDAKLAELRLAPASEMKEKEPAKP